MAGLREGRADSEAVYPVRGSVLSLSFVKPTNEIDQRDQKDKIPATRRETQNAPAFLADP